MERMFNWRDAFIGYLNLDVRTDRNEHMKTELARVGISAERIRGRLPHEFDLSDPQTMVMKNRTAGAIGCHFGQLEIMQRAFLENKDAIVFEDDLVFCSDLQERLDYIQNFLNKEGDWDVFFLGGTVHVNPPYWHKVGHSPDLQMCTCTLGRDAETTSDPHILRTYGAFSTHAYIVNKKSMPKIFKFFDENVHLSMGIDWLFILMQPQIKAFNFVSGCVKQMDNMSNIGNGVTVFSGFSRLGEYWWTDRMSDFNPNNFNWAEANMHD